MAPELTAWEHLVVYLEAHAQEETQFLQTKWPGKRFPRYAAEALIPKLDSYGEQGWELVSCEPVIVGVDGDILVGHSDWNKWTALFFCVFKRPKSLS